MHLDLLPRVKYRVQSRIYRFLVNRHLRHKEQNRIFDIVRRSSRSLLLGPAAPSNRDDLGEEKSQQIAPAKTMSRYGYGYSSGSGSDPSYGAERERGARRKKLLAIAGSALTAGRAAVTEIRETYNQGRARGLDFSEGHHTNIPGAFPNVSIIVEGEKQMVLFPSYAKNHVREYSKDRLEPNVSGEAGSLSDPEYWQEWKRDEDERAIVDVDVRGWLYSPHKGPMTRRNKLLIGAARQLSGIPPPRTPTTVEEAAEGESYEPQDQARIAKTAKEIERVGQREKDVALRGDYSEKPAPVREDSDPGFASSKNNSAHIGGQTSNSLPSSPTMGPVKAPTASELDDVELALANANLMSRLGPFLTTPLVRKPMTLFFYNDSQSQSRTVETDDSGHFSIRAALDFVPTHVRVIASENLSTIQTIHVIDPRGVSLISDIDDTIKRSNISLGAKEIFRNTFARDLSELTIPGVAKWYNNLCNMGVHMHYCSNSPWQLYPVLATFFKLAGLPDGSIHLKHYPGLLQGIFEPVAERKRPTLEKILDDFPERKFLLIGDSGEADLEVYTEIARAHPRRILAIFIRDVTTPEQPGFFDASLDPLVMKAASSSESSFVDISSDSEAPTLPPRPRSSRSHTMSIPIGFDSLVDISDKAREMELPRRVIEDTNIRRGNTLARKEPPPRPVKPAALRSTPSRLVLRENTFPVPENQRPPPPPKPRKPQTQHPLTQILNSSEQKTSWSSSMPRPSRCETVLREPTPTPPPPPPPRRRGTPTSILTSSSRSMTQRQTNTSDSDVASLKTLPSRINSTFDANGRTSTGEQYNKKLMIWRTRLERARDELRAIGVQLYTWRSGDDVLSEAENIVRDALKNMGLWH